MSRVLAGSIHVLNDDGSISTALAGTSEAAAKKLLPDASKSWGEHVWADVADDAEASPPAPPAAVPPPAGKK